MSMRYKGGIISATPPTISATTAGSFGSAPGIWTPEQQMQSQAASTWPLAYDPAFNYVTMLLQGDAPNGAQNNTFIDSSTNNFAITRGGNTTQGAIGPFGSNWSNYFNGNGNYLSAPYTAFTSVAGDFTIEAWINVSDAGRSIDANKIGAIISGYATNNITNSWLVTVTISGGVITTVTLTTSDVTRVTATGLSVSTNQWHHVAIVRSGVTVSIYVDGVSVASATYSASFTTNTLGTIQIARSAFGGSYQNWLKGFISNVRLVNGTAVYTTNFTPPIGPLTAVTNTTLLTCRNNRFSDSSANNYAITPTGTPSVQNISPFLSSSAYSPEVFGGSGYFDGTGDDLTIADNAAFFFGTGDYTVETFVYFNNIASNPWLIGQWVAPAQSDTNSSWQIATSANKFTAYVAYGNSTSQIALTGTTTIVNSAWYHVALVRNGTTHTLYVNGVAEASSTVVGANTLNDSTLVVLVGRRSGGTSLLSGYLSSTRVTKGAALYTSNFTPSATPLTASSSTSLLMNYTNAGIFDNSENNILETFGNVQINTSVKKYGTGSIAFDGAGDYTLNQYSPPLFDWWRGNYTLEAWIYPTTYTGWYYVDGTANKGTLIGNNAATSATNYWSFGLNSTGKLWFAYFTGTNQGGGSTDTVALNTWTHVAMVKNGTNITLYVNGNGTSLGAVVGTPQSSTTVSLLIGVGNNAYINGYVDGLRITQGIARYTANFTPPPGLFFNN